MKNLNDERLPKLMPMIEAGIPRDLIADALGITVNNLHVWCWNRGIKLPLGSIKPSGRQGKYGPAQAGMTYGRWIGFNEGRRSRAEIKAQAAQQPWVKLGISRQAWHKRKKKRIVDSTATPGVASAPQTQRAGHPLR